MKTSVEVPLGGARPSSLRVEGDGLGSCDPERYRVGDLLLDVSTGTVSRGGDSIPLPPRTFELLLTLARRHPGRVRRENLLETLWPSEVVSDQTLSHRVLLLRRALGDDCASPRYIAADRGWGYHLVVPVGRVTDAAPASAAPPSGRRRRLALPLVAVTLLAVTGILVHLRSRAGPPTPRLSVEVLPVDSGSGNVVHALLARRLTDRIALAIDTDRDLRVGTRPPPRGPASDRRVGGSLSARGETVLVRLQVLEPRSGRVLWVDGFEGSANEVFAAEDRLASLVAAGVRQSLRLPSRSSEDLAVAEEVSHLCLRAEWMMRSWQGPRLLGAATLFERALALDPASARAHAGLATVLVTLAFAGERSATEAAPVARIAAESAMRLEPDLPDARIARGLVRLAFDWDLAAAEGDLRGALERTKNDPLPLLAYALFLQAAGQPDASLPLLRLAGEADPDAAVVPLLVGHAHHLARRCERALEAYEEAIRQDPYLAVARSLAAGCYSDVGRDVLAFEALRRERGLAFAPARVLTRLERAHGRDGLSGLWARACEETGASTPAPVRAAAACARGGRSSDALRWLGRAAEERAPGLLFVRQDAAFDGIRGTSGFREALARSGLPDPPQVSETPERPRPPA